MPLKAAVLGLGYWGPNLVRNLSSLMNVRIAALCDLDLKRAENFRAKFAPQAQTTNDYRSILADPAIDAVFIATPIRTHFEIASEFLKAGKHVFIEKPLAQTGAECLELIALADKMRRILMVGHVFEYNVAVQRIKEFLDQGELGKLFYIYSQRVNLGRIQNDVNALWSFAPHDISILNYWLGQDPVRVCARGFSYLNNGVEDVVFVTLEYPGGIGAHLHLGWLDPRKVRLMTLVGSKKMLVYDDVSTDAKLQLYDKGIIHLDRFLDSPETFAEFQFQIRSGDLVIPSLQFSEPIHAECQHFIECIENGQRPVTDGWSGYRVVRVLEAAAQSLRQGGVSVEIAPLEPKPGPPVPAELKL